MVGVSRFPEKEGGRPAHGIDSPHNEGESPSQRGRFFLVECESIPRTGGWATRPRHRLSSQRGRVALTPRALFFGRVRVDSQNRRVGDPPTASTRLTTRASRPHSVGAFFWSSVNRFPEQEGGRPAHGIDSAHNEGESPSLRGRFFLVGCELIPRTGGWATRPRHRLAS